MEGAANKRPENDGQRKPRNWNLTNWKITDKLLTGYRVWKMTHWNYAAKM